MENSDIIQEKINLLRQSADPDDIGFVDQLERSMVRNAEYADYCDLDMTKRIVALVENFVESIVIRLGTEENMTELERKVLFEKKKIYLWLMVLLSKDYKAAMRNTEKRIDNALRKLGK